MSKVIAIDFDGCLVENRYPDIGGEIEETTEAYRQEAARGTEFILWTCRVGDDLQAALNWCEDHDIGFAAVNQNTPGNIARYGNDTRKVWADAYWDDRAVKMPDGEPKGEENAMSHQKRPKIRIEKPVYTLASADGSTAELTMYGDIYESRPVDWRGNPIEGNFVLLSEFLEDLTAIENCKDITVRMNSYGGDAGVSNTIHNRLRELSRNGASLTCVVDGVAMSGGSLIMCACDTVKANPSSLIMIHKCWSYLWGGYNADELRNQARDQDAWDRMQVEIYRRKTGLKEAELLEMMGETTYMTGREALEKGFVDELVENAEPVEVAASADGRSLFVAGRQMHLAPGMFAPDNIPTVTPGAAVPVETINNQPEDPGRKEVIHMTLEELRAQYPEQVAQVEAEALAAADHAEAAAAAVQAERRRLAEIDEVAGALPADLVQEAKYGEHPCTAAELALKAVQRTAKAGSRFLADAAEDAAASGADDVPAAPGPQEEPEEDNTPEARLEKARTAVKSLLGKKED